MSEAMTVAELIERLKSADPEAVVVLECDDHYYSGALRPEAITTGQALRQGPFDWESDGKDERGKKTMPVRTYRYPGGWLWAEDGQTPDKQPRGEVLERRPCLIIHVGT